MHRDHAPGESISPPRRKPEQDAANLRGHPINSAARLAAHPVNACTVAASALTASSGSSSICTPRCPPFRYTLVSVNAAWSIATATRGGLKADAVGVGIVVVSVQR